MKTPVSLQDSESFVELYRWADDQGNCASCKVFDDYQQGIWWCEGEFISPDGTYVGKFSRKIDLSDPDNPRTHNANLILNQSQRGKFPLESWLQSSESKLAEAGFNETIVLAGNSHGSWRWAKEYDWYEPSASLISRHKNHLWEQTPTPRRRTLESIWEIYSGKQRIQWAHDTGRISTPLYNQCVNFFENVLPKLPEKAVPTPQEVSCFGEKCSWDEHGHKMHLGKLLLITAEWQGIKKLATSNNS